MKQRVFSCVLVAGLSTVVVGTATAQSQVQDKIVPIRPSRLAENSAIVISLDETGVSDWAFLNPRRAPYIFGAVDKAIDALAQSPETKTRLKNFIRGIDAEGRRPLVPPPIFAAPLSQAAQDSEVAETVRLLRQTVLPHGVPLVIEFVNRSASRTLTVGFVLPLGAQAKKAIQDQDAAALKELRIGSGKDECKPDARTENCDVALEVLPNGAASLQTGIIARIVGPAPANPLVEFKVGFFDEEREPAYSRGYFRLLPQEAKPSESNTSSWGVVVQLSGVQEPSEPALKAATIDTPYRKRQPPHFPGAGRITLAQSLGRRATADVELTFKDKDFGGEPTVFSATKYQINMYGMKDMRLSLGRFLMTAPTSGIAVRENGEGFVFGFRNVGVGYLLKRETLLSELDTPDDDNNAWILTLNGWSPSVLRGVHSLNAVFVGGEENRSKDPKTQAALFPYSYRTLGGEFSFNVPVFRKIGRAHV